MYLTQGLHRALQCRPDRIATIFGERRQSYRQYVDRVARLAGALQSLGMGEGDRVGMLALGSIGAGAALLVGHRRDAHRLA